jgi:branched-chain amino acid transport system ATP-binding protein
MLNVEGLHAFYGLSHVLHGLSLSVTKGDVVALLGRNGAGKSTTMKAIMGVVPPRHGTVHFKGQGIAGLPPYRIARLGIAYVPEERRIFPDLTVRENLDIGRTENSSWTLERVYDLFPPLARLGRRLGGHLSGGEQQMLAIGRALMSDPQLLLLDEPSEGLAPVFVERLEDSLARLKTAGLTILLAEQNLEFIRSLANRGYIVDKGHVVYAGPVRDLWERKEMSVRYLAV